MATPTTHPTSFLFSCTTIITILLLLSTHNPQLADSKTLASDLQVLRSIKQSVDPNSIFSNSFLSTWNFVFDPCENPGAHFVGILCTIPEDNKNATSRITAIDLEGDGLEGFLTPILGNLTELTLLNLRGNKFRGPIPETITNLRRLTALILSDNFFSGTIPNRFGDLKMLQTIDLSENRLSGSLPGTISNFRAVTSLSLANNQFSGKIPDLTGLWQLNMLDLSENQLYGSLPKLPKSIRSLFLGRNLLTGHVLSINRLLNLRELDLSDNRLSGTIDQGIFVLPELTRLNISFNRFREIEVIKMSNRPSQLREIDIQSNLLRGHLPLNLATYESLTDVNLRRNLFSGEIPVKYGERVGSGAWKSLFLDYNLLEGSLPPGFLGKKMSITVSLAQNCLSCPRTNDMCRGGQKPPSVCIRRRNDRHR